MIKRLGEGPEVPRRFLHAPGRLLQGDEQAHLGSLGLHRVDKVAHHPRVEHLPALDADQRTADAALGVKRKPHDPIDAPVADLLLVGSAVRSGFDAAVLGFDVASVAGAPRGIA
jgi:hypothetical protein